MKLLAVIVFSILLSGTVAQKRALQCKPNNIKKQKCRPGKSFCIARVRGIAYKYEDVTSKSFIVSWNSVTAAKCYFVEVLKGNTGIPYKVVSCFKGTTYKATGLRPWQTYGFRVSAVNRRCKRGPPSSPVLTIKTLWDETFKATMATRRAFSPPVGKCGKKKFTCHSGGKGGCIPSNEWCDRVWQCDDGSDERFCPGGCKEINVDFKNGNYSCHLFGSPGSYCFFDCKPGYIRDGARYTKCANQGKKWSHAIPTCRLSPAQMLKVVSEETTDTTVTVEWEPVPNAQQYIFQAVEKLDVCDEDDEFTVSKVLNSTTCCRTMISGLKRNLEYQISMWAIDADGLHGMESMPVFVFAAKDPIKKS